MLRSLHTASSQSSELPLSLKTQEYEPSERASDFDFVHLSNKVLNEMYVVPTTLVLSKLFSTSNFSVFLVFPVPERLHQSQFDFAVLTQTPFWIPSSS